MWARHDRSLPDPKVVVIYYPYRVIPSAKNSRVRAGPKTVNLYEKGGLTRTEKIC